jgi:3-hydroxy-3-methylglutaryl CoA synthase
VSTPSRYSRSLLQLLTQQLTLLLDPIAHAAGSQEAMEGLLAELGVFTADTGHAAAFGPLLDLKTQIETLAAQDDLNFAQAQAALQASRDVLRRFGNMSSATVMFVMQSLLRSAPAGAAGCAMAFGPGLVAETMLFHAVG